MDDHEIDPNAAWDAVCWIAQAKKIPVEIIVRYEPPSEYAGRRLKLWYDPVTDKRGHEWLD